MNRYAVSILFSKETQKGRMFILRSWIINALSHKEALGECIVSRRDNETIDASIDTQTVLFIPENKENE